jgi:hypothetical protein
MGWIDLAEVREYWWALVNVVLNLRAPYNGGNVLTSCKSVCFSIRTLLHREPTLEVVEIAQILSKSEKKILTLREYLNAFLRRC